MIWEQRFYLLLLTCLCSHQANAAPCSCSLQSGSISCDQGTISAFPEDLASCNFDHQSVQIITLRRQNITKVGDFAFSSFTELFAVSIMYNENLVELLENAFEGLVKLVELHIVGNRIYSIPRGMLDSLVALEVLDLGSPPTDYAPYETNAWHLCDRLDTTVHGLAIEGDLAIEKKFKLNEYSQTYCQVRSLSDPTSHIDEVCGEQLDEQAYINCLSADNIARIACQIQEQPLDQILFEFKTSGYESSKDRVVEDFGKCETKIYFKEFNYNQYDSSEMKSMKSFTLYNTLFDIAELAKLTSRVTEKVTMYADTVFLTTPLAQPLNYTLQIRARKAILDKPIPMLMPRSAFSTGNSSQYDVEPFAQAEEHYVINEGLTMRWRKYGYVDILDQLPSLEVEPARFCNPKVLNAEEADTSDWFDVTSTNLNYVCAKTLLSAQSNNRLVYDLAQFNLAYANNKAINMDENVFTASQKFSQVIEQLKKSFIHNIPFNSIHTLMEMSTDMHREMYSYFQAELATEGYIDASNKFIADASALFIKVEDTQTEYLDIELYYLEEIFQFESPAWDWTFHHRGEMKRLMEEKLRDILEIVLGIEDSEYRGILKNAKSAVGHIDKIISIFREDVSRYSQTVKVSLQFQQEQLNTVVEIGGTFSNEFVRFNMNVEQWKEEKEGMACIGILGALTTIAQAFIVDDSFDSIAYDEYISLTSDAELSIEKLLIELKDIFFAINDIDQLVVDLNVDDASRNMSSKLSTALKNSYAYKDNAVRFEEIKNLAIMQIEALDNLVNHEITGLDALSSECASFTDSVQRIAEETAEFADRMLQLAEKNGDLELAKSHLEETVAQAESIGDMITSFVAAHKNYIADMTEINRIYEEVLGKWERYYPPIDEEEETICQQEIMSAFSAVKGTFSVASRSYRQQLSELALSVKKRSLGLKEHGMVQRSMLQTLFSYYCDAKFYSTFIPCSRFEFPQMSDEFGELLEKLHNLDWEALTLVDESHGAPVDFGSDEIPFQIVLRNDPDSFSYPIESLKLHYKLEVNLLQQDFGQHQFDQFWRIRLNMIRMILLDANGDLLPSPGQDEIKVKIIYPTSFNDTGFDHEKSLFFGQPHSCLANYVTIQGTQSAEFRSSCHEQAEFHSASCKPSLDGLFAFSLLNAEDLNMDQLGSAIIEFSGSYIPYVATTTAEPTGTTAKPTGTTPGSNMPTTTMTATTKTTTRRPRTSTFTPTASPVAETTSTTSAAASAWTNCILMCFVIVDIVRVAL